MKKSIVLYKYCTYSISLINKKNKSFVRSFFSSSFSSYSFLYSNCNFLLSKWIIFRLPPVTYHSNSEAWQIDQDRLALTLKVIVKLKVWLGIQSQIKGVN